MAKDINLTSQEWCDLVFEGKNKEYGAYEIRRTTSKRHLIALIAILLVAVFIAILPALAEKIAEAAKRNAPENLTGEIKMANLETEDEETFEDIIQETPPPPTQATIQFTAPIITASEDMNEENELKTMDELAKSDAAVYYIDNVGDPTGDVLPEDLLKHKDIVEDKKEIIYEFVDQQPDFPGGIEKFYEYIRRTVVYPQQAREANIQGTTMVRFVVTKSGALYRVIDFASSHPLLDKAADRVANRSPKWLPGKMNGQSVPCYYLIPVVFTLQ